MLLSILQQILSFWLQQWNRSKSQTKVVVVLHPDAIRTIEGIESKNDLPFIQISKHLQQKEDDKYQNSPSYQEIKNSSISIQIKENPQYRTIAQFDGNIISFILNVLLAHKDKPSIIITHPNSSLHKQIEQKTEIPPQQIFSYEASKAERKYLEERF